MSKNTKIWLAVAISLILIGIMLFGGVMMSLNWNFSKLSTVKYVTNTHQIGEDFDDILIDTGWAKIEFVLSEDGLCKVVCHERENLKNNVSVKDGVLSVTVQDQRKWYEHISIMDFDSPKITVYLPKLEYGSLSVKGSTGDIIVPADFNFENADIKTSTGDVSMYASSKGNIEIKTTTGDIKTEKISAKTVSLSVTTGHINASLIECEGDFSVKVSTGKATLTDVRCHNLTTSGSTGDTVLKNVIVTEKLYAKRSTGDVKLEKCDAGEIFIETDTGSVKGSLLSEKVFIVETDTGSINVPKTSKGGRCEISTDTGDIKISIVK